jgi:hypothetical protein
MEEPQHRQKQLVRFHAEIIDSFNKATQTFARLSFAPAKIMFSKHRPNGNATIIILVLQYLPPNGDQI